MSIKSYTSVAASNTSLFPENMAMSALNDGMRTVQADVRSWYVDAEWIDRGDPGVSRASNASFKITGDVTGVYHTGRRLKFYDASTLYGVIASSSYSAPDTTINVTTDSGNLSTSLTSVAVGILSATNISYPNTTEFPSITVSSAAQLKGTLTASGAAVFKTTMTVEGAVTISGAATFMTTCSVSGAAVFKTTATFEGAAVFKTTLTVEDDSTFSGTAVCKTGLVVEGSVATVKGNSTQSGRIELLEDTDNGTNKVTIAAPASIASDRTVSLPDTDISAFVVQRVSTQTGAVATGTTVIPQDDTIPQNTEGDQYMTLSITPKNSNNILVIEVNALLTHSESTGWDMIGALFQDSTANALAASAETRTAGGLFSNIRIRHVMTAGTTSSTTFKFRAGAGQAGTTTFNGANGTRRFGGVIPSNITIVEYSS